MRRSKRSWTSGMISVGILYHPYHEALRGPLDIDDVEHSIPYAVLVAFLYDHLCDLWEVMLLELTLQHIYDPAARFMRIPTFRMHAELLVVWAEPLIAGHLPPQSCPVPSGDGYGGVHSRWSADRRRHRSRAACSHTAGSMRCSFQSAGGRPHRGSAAAQLRCVAPDR